MSQTVTMGWNILDRMEHAVLKVRERLLRATAALNAARIPYAVVGGNAVASWVATIDAGAVRNTRDIDILVCRTDFPAMTVALAAVGFIGDEDLGVPTFLDGPSAKPSESIHIIFSAEKVRHDHLFPAPEVTTVDDPEGFRVITLDSLLVMKLMANRRKDQVHIEDLIGVGLIDKTWLAKLPPVLGERLQQIIDTPQG